MKKIEGCGEVRLLECVNPMRNRWRIRWDVQKKEDGVMYMEEEFGHKPSCDEIAETVLGWINGKTADDILSGMTFEGSMVWLSAENQRNYKAACDLATQTGGANLPVKVKLGTDGCPVYKTFDSVDSLNAFYTSVNNHIQSSIEEGWRRKDAFDASVYLE